MSDKIYISEFCEKIAFQTQLIFDAAEKIGNFLIHDLVCVIRDVHVEPYALQ